MPDNLTRILFSGLDDSSTNATEGARGEQPNWKCPVLQNLRRREGKLVQRRGQQPISTTAYSDLQMLFWTTLGGSQEYLLAVASGSVYDAFTGSVITSGAHRFTPGTECNAAWINDWVVIGNGTDPNVRFDGSTIARLTVQPASATGMVLTAGAAGSPNGTYTYAVKFLNADGIEGDIQGLGSAVPGVSPSITVTNKRISLASIPVCPTGQDCSGKNLYRTKDGGSAYFFVATLANATTTSTDNLADSQLGLEMQNLAFPNSPFPPCRYFATHMGRLFGGGCQTTESGVNVLHYSDDLDPTTARVSTDVSTTWQGGRVVLADRSGGAITGLSESFGSSLVVFTGGNMNLWTGTDTTSFELYPFAPHGCVAHRTIGRYQNLLLWLAPDGAYAYVGSQAAAFQGANFRRISDDLRVTIDSMTAAEMAGASAVVADSRYYLVTSERSLVCDFLFDEAWYADEPQRFGSATVSLFTPDNRARIWAQNLTDRTVWQLETGTSDNGDPIPCRVRSADLGKSAQGQKLISFGGLFRASSDWVSGTVIRGTSQRAQTTVVNMLSGSTATVPFNVDQYPLSTCRMRQRFLANGPAEHWALELACDSRTGTFEIIEGVLELDDAGGVSY
jgi:hypothetical protein